MVKTSARKNSSHVSANVKTMKIRMAGHANGTMILHNMRSVDAPSIRAASMSDLGADKNAARNQKIPNATSPETSMRMSAVHVLIRPRALMS